MHVLRTEFDVAAYDEWKAAFEDDPAGRKQAGVRRYRVMRAADDADHVLLDLEFDGAGEAEAFLERLHEIWPTIDAIRDPRGRVVEVVDSREY